MAKSRKNKYKVVIGAQRLNDVGDGKEKRPEEMIQPMGPENSRMMPRFSEESELKTFGEFNEALKDRRFLANKKPVKTPSWRKPLDQWQDRVNKAVDKMTEPKEKNEQIEYDKFGHVTKKPKSARETLVKRIRLGRAKHTPHPAPIQGGQYKETPQMERPHYEETEMTDKTFSKFVAEARRGRPPKNVPAEPEHIVMQLRKVVSMRGQAPVEFKDGKKVKMTPELAHKALEMHDNMKKPADKEQFAHHISHSLDHMKSGLKGNWQAEDKPKITLAGPKLKKEEAEQIDELSKKTLASYAKKAGGTSLDSAAAYAMDNNKKKAIQRAKGVEKAIDKLTKEESEIEEAKDSLKAFERRLAGKAKNSPKDEGSWSKKMKKQEKEAQLAKEEAEQIDELSLGMLAAYAAKSAGSAAKAAGTMAGRAAVDVAKKTPEAIAKAAKATGKGIGKVVSAFGTGDGKMAPMPKAQPNPEDKEEKDQKPAKPKNLADTLYNRRNQEDGQPADQQTEKPAAGKNDKQMNILRKRKAGLQMLGKKAVSSIKKEDYAPLENGKVNKHPDDANSPADSTKKKQGAEKPVSMKDPMSGKYKMKEALEFYEGLSDEHKAAYADMTLEQIVDLLSKYEEQQ